MVQTRVVQLGLEVVCSVPLIVTLPAAKVGARLCRVPLKVTEPVPDAAVWVCTCLLWRLPERDTFPVPAIAAEPAMLCSAPLIVAEPVPGVPAVTRATRLPPKKMYSAVVLPLPSVSARMSPPEPYQ